MTANRVSRSLRYNPIAKSSVERYLAVMEPAKNIIARLGGPAQVADALGIHRTRPYCWMKSRERGGTGGLIPQEHFQRLIEIGAERGVVLTGDDFVPTPSVRKASA